MLEQLLALRSWLSPNTQTTQGGKLLVMHAILFLNEYFHMTLYHVANDYYVFLTRNAMVTCF